MHWLLPLFWIVPSFAAEKVAVILCFPSDSQIRNQCAVAQKKLETAGIRVVRVLVTQPSTAVKTIADELAKAEVPSLAPVFIAGHGIDFRGPTILTKNKTLGLSVASPPSVETKDVVKAIRSQLKKTPIWVSTCQSGGACSFDDICIGASCLREEKAYVNRLPGSPKNGEDMQEDAMRIVTDLLVDPTKFEKYDKDHDGKLVLAELNQAFCDILGEKVVAKIYTTEPTEAKTAPKDRTYVSSADDMVSVLASLKQKHGSENVTSEKRTTNSGHTEFLVKITLKGQACSHVEVGWTGVVNPQTPQLGNFTLYKPGFSETAASQNLKKSH